MSDVLTCQKFFDGLTLHGPTKITFENGVVVRTESFEGQADHHLIAPGLVDIQMNGFGSIDVSRATSAEMATLGNELAMLGTTSWLGTITTAPLDVLLRSIHSLHQMFSTQVVPGFTGIHVEGPFLGDAPGAHRPDWIIPFDEEWCSQLPKSIRLMTVAAEQSDASSSIRQLVQMGITVSVGHSRPTDIQWKQAREAGATVVTHLFNGMSGVHHREAGLALSALIDDGVYTGLIADMVHVSPQAVSLAFKAKGGDRVCLVSDSVAWQSEWALKRKIAVKDGAPRLPDGTLAGSSTPLAECVRLAVNEAGVPLRDALCAATSSPASAVGLTDAGHIREGAPADLIAFDQSLHVVRTWRRLVSIRG